MDAIEEVEVKVDLCHLHRLLLVTTTLPHQFQVLKEGWFGAQVLNDYFPRLPSHRLELLMDTMVNAI